MTEKPQQFNPILIAFYSGLASLVGDMVMFPFDTIGTRIKAHKSKFLGMRQGYDLIVKNEGFKYLFKGFSTTVMGSFIPYGSYFLAYEYMNYYAIKLTKGLEKDGEKSKLNLLIPLITSPLAEAVSVITYIPFDTLRTRMQMNVPEYNYKGIYSGLIEISQKEGWIRLFQASHLYMASVVVYTTFQMWFYELLRYQILRRRSDQKLHNQPLAIHQSIIATMISTALAAAIVNPVDFIITRYQLVDSSQQQLSVKVLVQEAWRQEGKKAFLKGLGTRVFQCSIFSIFYFPVYDHFKSKYGITLAD
ncbi:unnamed protein product (macronuclear) [Paramecium tetraurelia]|uniref:Mitochondrial carrier protein n=1 Tax=Paramecium tetraurelia TaxID=5888 RepID=A0EDQ0_PARTE|nr:uncharacterized protein GSPATT00025761001 [Paramecium tetraurelia]CAK93417.1 unnamed protein product [Paramecium tetraurelia]|eukprot:XP_001460814.1 hypothetical protein (macronuclear) [Paramecium tetraurelia strain d4-2]